MKGAANAVPEKVQRDIPAEKKSDREGKKTRRAQRREAQRRVAQRREAQGERRREAADEVRRKKARRGGERRKGERRKDARGGEAQMRDAKQKGSGARCPTSFVMKLCASIIFRPPPDGASEASLVDSNA